MEKKYIIYSMNATERMELKNIGKEIKALSNQWKEQSKRVNSMNKDISEKGK